MKSVFKWVFRWWIFGIVLFSIISLHLMEQFISIPGFIVLHSRGFFVFFFWIEELWQPHVKQFCWCHFFSSFGSLLSLCHILVILTLFQSLSKLWYLLLWSMINDLWGYYSNCFGFHELQLYEMVGLTDTFMFALTTLSTDSSPTCFSLLSPSYSLRYSDT